MPAKSTKPTRATGAGPRRVKPTQPATMDAPIHLSAPTNGNVQLIDPSLLFEREERASDVFNFRLSATVPDQEVYLRCRRVGLADTLLEGDFPAEFSAKVMSGLKAIAEHPEMLDSLSNAESEAEIVSGIGVLPSFRPLMDAAIVTAAVEPRVYLDRDEAKAAGGLWVGHIRIMDKISLIGELKGEDTAAADAFRATA